MLQNTTLQKLNESRHELQSITDEWFDYLFNCIIHKAQIQWTTPPTPFHQLVMFHFITFLHETTLLDVL